MDSTRYRGKMFTHIFFDLDGTLSQSDEGILNGVEYALNKYGYPLPPRDSLRVFIGPPLVAMFAEYCSVTMDEAELLANYYREFYNTMGGVYQCAIYDGIIPLLQELKANGKKVYVVTAKPKEPSLMVLDHFGITPLFDGIYAATNKNSTSDKTYLVKSAMDGVRQTEEVANENFVMVGDRKYDVEGALNNGIAVAGVLYGYGDLAEMEEAKATYICPTVADLRTVLLSK